MLFELVILMGGLFAIRHHLTSGAVQISGLIALYLISAKLINPGLDLKILHDIAIIYIFYKLGTLASIETGNRTLWTIMMIVLAVGFFELLLPATFSQFFDVWSYYVDKGTIGQNVVNYSHSNLFVSANRGSLEARTFLPGLLGTHRVSSVFLEPVSMGNFASITFAWCLSISSGKRWNQVILILLAAVCIVLSDSRFGSVCCMIMLFLRFILPVKSGFVVFLMPVLTVFALTITGAFHEMPGVLPSIQEDNFPGRLLFSGRLLDYWNLRQWLGIAASQVYTSDTGYAYVINNLGLPLSLFLLAIFAAYMTKSKEAVTMKAMIGVYLATSLCVGASVFSIKTAALLWFLYGTTNSVFRARSRILPNEPSGSPPCGVPPYANEGFSA